jgi:probable rRNA maturation factor
MVASPQADGRPGACAKGAGASGAQALASRAMASLPSPMPPGPSFDVDVWVSPLWIERDWDALCARAVEAAAAAHGGAGGEVAIRLTDDAELARLNLAFRGKDRPTDILSFPDPDPARLGDIAIALETCATAAAKRGVPLGAHVQRLVVHGALHLLGHDHARGADAAVMESLEREAMRNLGLHDPYSDDEDHG